MRRVFLFIVSCAAAISAFADYDVTASKVTIQDLTVDKDNFFVTVEAATSSGEYEIAFDLWPATHSAIGTFSAADGTIGYVSSFVHKTKANGSAVDMWYVCQEDSPVSLSIVDNGDSTCTLSGSITATRNGTAYTYNIAPFVFDYYEDESVTPQEDPYRFEPVKDTTIHFTADVIRFRDRGEYIEVTLNEMANETYDWIELRLLSDTMAMPAGDYTIDDSGSAGTLTASAGYLGSVKGDDPCYVAIRASKEDWGQYTPYYLTSGTLSVSYNALGDTIGITGQAHSYNGSTIHISARGYNMLYVPEEKPREPEDVTLAIDTVTVTYLSDQSDSINNRYRYTMDFSAGDEFPNVLVDVILSAPMALVEGTYTLEDSTLIGLNLFQNQADFNAVFFGGEPYVFETASLTLTKANSTDWTYSMLITDTIGSKYHFSLTQAPHIIFYPLPEDTTAVKDKPYADEQKETATITIALDSLVWKSNTVARDGILDIILTQRTADVNGLRAYLHLGMYTEAEYPAAGDYPVNDSETNGSFSASLGRFGNTLIPCYLTLVDNNGWVHAVWYIVEGTIQLSYKEDQPLLSGECRSYFGSTVRFAYSPDNSQGLGEVRRDDVQCTKVLRDGTVLIERNGALYNLQGKLVKE